MNTGLTIAFICNGKSHPTIINYNKFGNYYWDDTPNNNSKIGYYFAYYFQQKYVFIHKITNILQPCERPSSMSWTSNRQILCLSEQLKKFNWNEWITGIGKGSPYTPTYRMTQTGSWSCSELHKKYNAFNFINFQNIIEKQTTNITTLLSCDKCDNDNEEEDDEAILMREIAEEERIRKEANDAKLRAIRANKMRKDMTPIREEECGRIAIKIQQLREEIGKIQLHIDMENKLRNAVMQGERDSELINQKLDNIKLNIEC
jgi:hypothetical protein